MPESRTLLKATDETCPPVHRDFQNIFNKFQTPMTLTVDRTIVSKNVNDLLRAQLCAASSCSFISTKDRAVL